MPAINIDRDHLFDLLEGSIEVSRTKHHRHNQEFVTVVVFMDEKPYIGTYEVDAVEGIPDMDVDFVPAVKKTVITEIWVPAE